MALLVPQYLLIAGILVVSFLPKLLIGPISAAIDPYFASTLVWDGMSLEMIYGYWNPVPTMAIAVAVSVALFFAFWLFQRSGRIKSSGARATAWSDTATSFYNFYKAAFSRLTPPVASAFWEGLAVGTMALAARTRRVYTGDGQTYSLYILYYFIVLYIVSRAVAGI